MKTYLVKVDGKLTRKKYIEEFSQFGNVEFISRQFFIFSLETDESNLPLIEDLSFVVIVEEDGKGSLSLLKKKV